MNIKMQYLTIIAAGMLITSDTATADEDKKIRAVAGAGASTSCGKFLEQSKEHDLVMPLVYFSWTQGYLSGLNAVYVLGLGEITDLSDVAGQKLWLQNYCKENPLKSYHTAAWTLWRTLRTEQGFETDFLRALKNPRIQSP